MSQQALDGAKQVADAASLAAAIGTVAGWLPPLAALLTIIWTGLRIWESPTVQGWVRRRRRAE